jgi:hypothetical protein
LARVKVHGATGERLLLRVPVEGEVDTARTVLAGQEVGTG